MILAALLISSLAHAAFECREFSVVKVTDKVRTTTRENLCYDRTTGEVHSASCADPSCIAFTKKNTVPKNIILKNLKKTGNPMFSVCTHADGTPVMFQILDSGKTPADLVKCVFADGSYIDIARLLKP